MMTFFTGGRRISDCSNFQPSITQPNNAPSQQTRNQNVRILQPSAKRKQTLSPKSAAQNAAHSGIAPATAKRPTGRTTRQTAPASPVNPPPPDQPRPYLSQFPKLHAWGAGLRARAGGPEWGGHDADDDADGEWGGGVSLLVY